MIVIGGGLAGLATACALADAGMAVVLYERRRSLGGRTSSFAPVGTGTLVDNGQHVLMRCCTNLLDFLERLGVSHHIRFHSQVMFLDRKGRLSPLAGGVLPAPLHLLPSFARLRFLGTSDKLAIAWALVAMMRQRACDEEAPFSAWLLAHGQTRRAIEAFWRPVLVGALNEEPDQIATRYGLLVFRDGFLRHRHSYQVGIPTVPLSDLFAAPAKDHLSRRGAEVECGSPASRILVANGRVDGVRLADGRVVTADHYISAVPPWELTRLLPAEVAQRAPFAALGGLVPAPIASVHLWFDRLVTGLDHAALVDRPIHWAFNKSVHFGLGGGTWMAMVVSAAYALAQQSREEIVRLALTEAREAFPAAREAALVRALVTKERRATFSPRPGCDALRPFQATPIERLFLAGDWTRTGWPGTMEGAVRSGYLAAEAVLAAAGTPRRLLVPDLPAAPLVRLLGYRPEV